jgi:hypothetical protein
VRPDGQVLKPSVAACPAAAPAALAACCSDAQLLECCHVEILYCSTHCWSVVILASVCVLTCFPGNAGLLCNMSQAWPAQTESPVSVLACVRCRAADMSYRHPRAQHAYIYEALLSTAAAVNLQSAYLLDKHCEPCLYGCPARNKSPAHAHDYRMPQEKFSVLKRPACLHCGFTGLLPGICTLAV